MLESLTKIKREIYKSLSNQLLEWSKEPAKPTLDTVLKDNDAGLALVRNNGLLQIYVHSKTEEESINLLVDLLRSNFSDLAYQVLVEKFPGIKEKINEIISAVMQEENLQIVQEQPDLDSNEDDEDEPLVDPLMPRG